MIVNHHPSLSSACIARINLAPPPDCAKAADARCQCICICVVRSWFSMFHAVSGHTCRCVRRCAVRCPPRAKDPRRFLLGLSDAEPVYIQEEKTRNPICPYPLLYSLLAISLLPSHALYHINHTTTLFLYTTTLFLSQSARPFVTDTQS